MAQTAKKNNGTWRRLGGLILVGLGVMVGLALLSYDWQDIGLLKASPNQPPANLVGPVGAWSSFLLLMLMGWAAYLVPVGMVMGGLRLWLKPDEPPAARAVWAVLWMLSVAAIAELTAPVWGGFRARLNLYDTGGLVGRLVVRSLLVRWLSTVGTSLVIGVWFLVTLAFLVGFETFSRATRTVWGAVRDRVASGWGRRRSRRAHESPADEEEPEQTEIELIVEDGGATPAPGLPPTAERPTVPPRAPVAPSRPARPEPPPPPPAPAEGTIRARAGTPEREEPAQTAGGPDVGTDQGELAYQLPPPSLLDPIPPVSKEPKLDVATASNVLLKTLQEFGIEARIVNIEEGPTVTSFQLLPALGVRVERIVGLSKTLAMALKAEAESVRVQAPVPGKGVVGIEVPNVAGRTVYLREMIESPAWRPAEIRIPVIIGKDVSGADIIADLAEMPHLLVAGATGSGKTVCINTILAGLLMARTPRELRLLLIDPKVVEFSLFNGIPHLAAPVITQPQKVALGLRWAIGEMESRYKLLARNNVRDIESFNRRPVVKQRELFEIGREEKEPNKEEPPARLPYIVIVIDELADLMHTASSDVENSVARLAQLSRAVGIHMILSTQRPSVDVLTGTIKANFPSRIAFQVAQKVDSRTILDAVGAENLLGKGDMLFQPPGSSKLIRAQGAKTSDEELRRIVEFIKRQGEPRYDLPIQTSEEAGEGEDEENGDAEPDDEMLRRAIQVIRETRRASTSSLQRRLKIGYTRAGRIMDVLQDRGVVGPPRGSEPREILVDLDAPIPGLEPDDGERGTPPHGFGRDAP